MIDNDRLESLMARVALQDRRAFRELYDLASPHLFGVAMRMVRTRELAEEVLQDGFVQIWQNAGSYRAEQSRPVTWMTSIVRYRALDLLRRSRRDVSLDDVSEAELPKVMFATDEGEPALARCLEELNDSQRACIRMAFVEGYSHDELSRRIGSPLGTVKSWIRRGLGQLRECLGR